MAELPSTAFDPYPGATLEEMATRARQPCPRCRGRMLTTGSDGDLACFSCGHLIYRWVPDTQPPPRRRGASSGGRSLD